MQKNIDQSVSTHCNHIKILMEGMPAFELINMEFNKILNEICDGEVFGPLLTALRNGDIGFLNAMLAEGGQLPGMCGIGLGDIPGVDALVEYTENLYGKFIDKLKGDRVKLANVTNTKVENLKDISAILSEISL